MTSPVVDFETLAARALNTARLAHKPTYAGLRILLQSASNDKAAFTSFLAHRCQTRSEWRYFGFQIVKEAAKGKPPSFRNCVFGSPLTALAEAHVLSLMAQEPAFAVPQAAFSYRWPVERKAGRNFEYFIEGYDQRNRAVGRLLAQRPGSVAVVADVKSFYPSVRKELLHSAIEQRCRWVKDPAIGTTIRQFATGLLEMHSPKTSGLPIGPDLSHALGHVALASVDETLRARFGECYLRYVDDIIVVVPQAEMSSSLRAIRDALAVEGLALNEDKQDAVDGAAWQADAVFFDVAASSPTFDSVLDEITHYLIRRPRAADELHARFRDAGFSLPIGRSRSLANSKRFRQHFRRKAGGFVHWLTSWFTSPETLLAQAEAVRRELTAEARRLAAEPTPAGPQRRRWYVQKRRSVLNRLLYLCPPTQYQMLRDLTPDVDEFAEYRLVLESLSSGDFTQALGYPGRVATALCQLWPEHHAGSSPHIAWPSLPTRMDAEAAAHFALYLSVVPPATFLRALDQHTPGARMLVEICGRGPIDPAGIEPLSYLDEMNLLYGELAHEEVTRLISSRFDELEDVGLDGLILGCGTYFLPFDFPVFSG